MFPAVNEKSTCFSAQSDLRAIVTDHMGADLAKSGALLPDARRPGIQQPQQVYGPLQNSMGTGCETVSIRFAPREGISPNRPTGVI